MAIAPGLPELLAAPAASDPQRVALVIGDEHIGYGRLEAAAGSVAAGLRRIGAEPGRAVLCDDASLLSIATVIGAPRVGVVPAMVNPRLTAKEIGELARTARTGPIAVSGTEAAQRVAAATGAHVLGGTELLDPHSGVDAPAGFDDGDEAVVLFTSGTTGTPKVIPLSHGLLRARVATFAGGFDPARPPAVSLMCVPLVHIGGLLGLLVSLARGNTTVVQTRFDAGAWLALVERHRVEAAFVVPTMLHRILEHPAFDDTDLGSLSAVTYGAAPAPPSLIARAMDAIPHAAFVNVFGQTETLGSITALGPDDHRHPERRASVGRPLPGVEVRVVDPVTLDSVPTGTVGELWVRTTAAVAPEEPSEASGGPPGPAGTAMHDGWLRTGDLIREDPDGYLYAAGRLSETINRGGEKFPPAEVEAALRAHPAVRDAAVIGMPDEELGHRVCAAVVVDGPVTVDELQASCRQHIARFKVPEQIVLVDEIPYNDVGKVSRRTLQALLAGVG